MRKQYAAQRLSRAEFAAADQRTSDIANLDSLQVESNFETFNREQTRDRHASGRVGAKHSPVNTTSEVSASANNSMLASMTSQIAAAAKRNAGGPNAACAAELRYSHIGVGPDAGTATNVHAGAWQRDGKRALLRARPEHDASMHRYSDELSSSKNSCMSSDNPHKLLDTQIGRHEHCRAQTR